MSLEVHRSPRLLKQLLLPVSSETPKRNVSAHKRPIVEVFDENSHDASVKRRKTEFDSVVRTISNNDELSKSLNLVTY